ncbi:MAG: hypothetical protein M1157_09050 [Deinococcus sp.]|nr:hypothetical protein [Deinococcus sp.]
MRVRATLKALAVRLDGNETPEEVRKSLVGLPELPLEIEVGASLDQTMLETLLEIGRTRGISLRAPRGERYIPYTEVVPVTLRSGQKIESAATVVVLGDVNHGAEIVAAGDVIVAGKLRGLAHAGAKGNEEASVWAGSLEAKQLRIAHLVAQAPQDKSVSRGSERAYVAEGKIVLEPWGRGRL